MARGVVGGLPLHLHRLVLPETIIRANVFFALIGGLAAFGGIGLVLGPLVLTFLVAATRLYRREFAAEHDVDAAPAPH